MRCLKCGKKTNETRVFCDDCLSTMDAYPVKPDVHVQLPNRSAASAVKKSGKKRRAPTPEEQVILLRSRIRRLRALVMLLLAMLAVAGVLLVHSVMTHEDSTPDKDYSFVNPFK